MACGRSCVTMQPAEGEVADVRWDHEQAWTRDLKGPSKPGYATTEAERLNPPVLEGISR